MSTEAELFDALALRVEISKFGTRGHYNSAGQLHRDGGPAVIWCNGCKEWWQNGKLHREDGPAVEYPSGFHCWYLYGVRYTKLDYYQELVDKGLYKDR